MLLINNQQVSVTQFVEKVKQITGKDIPLDDLKSNKEFKYNPSKKGYDLGLYKTRQMRVQKVLLKDDVLASFNVWSDTDQSTVEFRFANRTPYTNPKNPTVLVHDPKAIEIPGGVFNFDDRDIEKALYLYVNPLCFDSPFHKDGSPYRYSHNNLKAQSKKKLKEMSLKQKAFQHASNVDEDDLKVLALGLKLDLIPNADSDDIRAAIQEYALENASVYLEKTSTETIKYEGMIQEALDTKFIIKKMMGGVPTFEFAKGPKKGQQIMVVMSNNNNDQGELVLHMKKNIAEYYPILASFNHDVTADNSAEQYLSNLKNGVSKNDIKPFKEEVTFDKVVDFNSAKEFLKSSHPEGANPSPANTKAFLEKVQSGEVTNENVSEIAKSYIKQS